jgi:hypothetical protein
MGNILAYIIITVFQFFAGFGLIKLFKIELKPMLTISLSVLLGVGIFSFIPFLLQLLYIPITATNVFIALAVVTALLNINKNILTEIKFLFTNTGIKIKLYELPFLLLIAFIVFVSAWRCFYFPPFARDLTSGPEAIAEFATREHTMLNSIFTINLESTNNQFKPAFIAGLQIIYKFAGFPFGQVWLTTTVIFFLVFLYNVIIEKQHKIIAGLLLLFFLAIREMYAYTLLVLFDYSNAVFFFLAAYFLFKYFEKKTINYLNFSALLMGIATYVRSETLVLAAFFAPLIIFYLFKQKKSIVKIITANILFMLPALLFYLVSITLYINHYLPVQYPVGGQINQHLGDLNPFLNRFADMNKSLIFGENATSFYNYFFYFFTGLLLLEAIAFKLKFTLEGRRWLYAILVIYIGLPFLGYLLPLMDLNNTTKRALFKFFPLAILYLANNQVFSFLSQKLNKLENK